MIYTIIVFHILIWRKLYLYYFAQRQIERVEDLKREDEEDSYEQEEDSIEEYDLDEEHLKDYEADDELTEESDSEEQIEENERKWNGKKDEYQVKDNERDEELVEECSLEEDQVEDNEQEDDRATENYLEKEQEKESELHEEQIKECEKDEELVEKYDQDYDEVERLETRNTVSFFLKENKNWVTGDYLGSGCFGDVIKCFDPSSETNLAIKIVPWVEELENESKLWQKISHPNIVPLLEVIKIDILEVTLFIMPCLGQNLAGLMKDSSNNEIFLAQIKTYLRHVLKGLEYLKVNNMCHLDIKIDNILISSSKEEAYICDFTFINDGTKSLSRRELGLPTIYKPPEACLSLGDDISVDGIAFDAWSFGILTTEILTGCQLWEKAEGENSLKNEVYPVLHNILQTENLSDSLAKVFKHDEIDTNQVQLARDFIYSFLKMNPSDRTTPDKAMRHDFLLTQKIAEDACEDLDDGENKPKKRKNRIGKWMRKRFSNFRKLFCCVSSQDPDTDV